MSEAERAGDGKSAGQPRLLQRLANWLKHDGEPETVREMIEELIEERPDNGGLIDSHERLLIANVLRLRDINAADIMVPRADIVAVEAETSLPEVQRLLVKEGHSRFPVYRQTLDDVIGLVHIKDLAVLSFDRPASQEPKEYPPLGKLVRNVLFVSPAARVLDLLLEMRLKRTHMAMVVDEYGGIDGLVTIENVVEQIVGEIEDEHDEPSAPRMKQVDGAVTADARVTLADFEEQWGSVFSEEERETNDTLGGLVTGLAGHVPGRGELIRHPSGMEFEVIEGDPRRVRRLRIRNIPAATAHEPAAEL
jgi:CBS domain containing-hemolysin-like protein